MLLGMRLIVAVGAFCAFSASDLIFGIGRAAEAAMVLPTDPARLSVETDGGEQSFSVEIADEPAERSAGLMYRQSMPDDHGMLFVMDGTGPVGFWMQNTPMPLDLLFIAEDGTVRRVMRGEPMSEALITPGEPVRFVLELKAGTADRLGIERGDRINHPAITRN